MNDPTERLDKADERNVENQKAGFPHYRSQLYPHFVHRDFIFITAIIFYKKTKNFLLFNLRVYNFLGSCTYYLKSRIKKVIVVYHNFN